MRTTHHLTGKQSRLAFLLCILLLGSAAPINLMAEEQYWAYTVRPGDNIWTLTERHCTNVLDWQRIQKINNIPDGPDRRLKPGTRLKFPVSLLKHQPAAASIAQLQGDGTVMRAGGKSQPLKEDMQLHSGDKIITAEKGNLTIRFADGSELLLLGNTEVVMDNLSAYGETGMVDSRIRLQGGRVETRVKTQRGPGSRYEIQTPAAVAAVRGTNFRVAADIKESITRSEVLDGKIGVMGSGQSRAVGAGYGVTAKTGAPPTIPKPLLPAPDLVSVEQLQERIPLQFNWSPLGGAKKYRFQIAPDKRFDRLLADRQVEKNGGAWPDLPDGQYILRVRGIDDQGLEGLNADKPFTIDARPEPPILMNLTNGRIVREPKPDFSWSTTQESKQYHLQIARDRDFTDYLVDNPNYTDSRFIPDTPLQEGIYYWRLATREASGDTGPFSDPENFEYKRKPISPELGPAEFGKNEMVFSWKSASENMRYHFQIASDADFKNIEVDKHLETSEISLPRLAPNNYWIRIRAIDETDYASPFGAAHKINVPGSFWPMLVPAVFLLLV